MTTLAATDSGRTTAATAIRRPGLLCLWAGVLGAVSGVFLAVVPAAVEDDRYSYPLGATGFVAIQVWFVVQHLGLLAGLVGLGRSGAAGTHRLGVRVAIAGMALLTATEALAISAARSPYPGGLRTDLLDAGYGVSCMAIGVGLVVAGVAVLRAGVWEGWRRWVPVATGVYVFVPMLPALLGGFLAARLAITGWMLLFAVLGLALVREQRA